MTPVAPWLSPLKMLSMERTIIPAKKHQLARERLRMSAKTARMLLKSAAAKAGIISRFTIEGVWLNRWVSGS
jgi:hypothetical protein